MDSFDVLAVLFYGCALVEVAAVLLAAAVAGRRREALLTASVLLGVAGVLGIFSVGVVILVAAAGCAVAAARTRPAE